MYNLNKKEIVIVGLGYVGLPLSIEFGRKFKTLGYDISKKRVSELKKKFDSSYQISKRQIKYSKKFNITSNTNDIKKKDFYIITVPTPINFKNEPDLKNLIEATKLVGKSIKIGSIVIFESTVYPGCTEEICVPILEKQSKLSFNKDFFCGFSPERINIGDNRYTLTKIKKVVSGSNLETLEKINSLYKSIIKAGTYKAESVKIAEASKVIENTQRDLNIALVNEFSLIFQKLKLDTNDVLDAASTKWNFIKYKPGLVGGHCIGVDPYYLAYKSKKAGHNPRIILNGRSLNDNMSTHVFKRIIDLTKKNKMMPKKIKCLILGCTFKKNCNDIRNSKVFDLAKKIKKSFKQLDIYDPWIDINKTKKKFKYNFIKKLNTRYDIIILAVAHDKFKSIRNIIFKKNLKLKYIVYDLKSFLDRNKITERL